MASSTEPSEIRNLLSPYRSAAPACRRQGDAALRDSLLLSFKSQIRHSQSEILLSSILPSFPPSSFYPSNLPSFLPVFLSSSLPLLQFFRSSFNLHRSFRPSSFILHHSSLIVVMFIVHRSSLIVVQVLHPSSFILHRSRIRPSTFIAHRSKVPHSQIRNLFSPLLPCSSAPLLIFRNSTFAIRHPKSFSPPAPLLLRSPAHFPQSAFRNPQSPIAYLLDTPYYFIQSFKI